MVNKVILIGNVGADPEIRHVSEGLPVAKLRFATSETYTDKKGERITKSEWHNIVLWRGLATVTEKYVTKGMQLYIEGKITYNKYEKDGETKYMTEIVASDLKLLGRKGDGSSAPSEPKKEKEIEPTPFVVDFETQNNTDDLPF